MAFEAENVIAPRFLAMRSRLRDQGLAPQGLYHHCKLSQVSDYKSKTVPSHRPSILLRFKIELIFRMVLIDQMIDTGKAEL